MSISTWEFIRASGLTSYILLFLSVTAGLLLAIKVANGKMNKLLQIIHKSTGWFSLLFGLFHGLLLSIDHYQPFTLGEIFIPFMAKEHPILNGIGTLSLYLLILLFLSADFMKKIGHKTWKIIHRFALPCFFFISIHGIFLGTDTKETSGIILYASSLAVIVSLVVVKLLNINKEKTKKAVTM